MLRKGKKGLAIILTLAMLATLMVAAPVSAKSVNSVDKVIAVGDSYVGKIATLTVQEDYDFVNHFKSDETFTLRLPSPVKWDRANVKVNWQPAGGAAVELLASGDAKFINNQTLDITFPGGAAAPNPTGQDFMDIDLAVDVNGATGEIAVTVDSLDSAITGGTYTFATVGTGKTTVLAQSVEKIGKAGVGGVIEIREVNLGAMPAAANKFTLKVPSNFEWDPGKTQISLGAGFSGLAASAVSYDGRVLEFTVTPAAGATQRGVIYVTPGIKATRDAKKGDVEVSVSGTSGATSVADADVIVAEYVDYGISAKVYEVKELKAGKFDQKSEMITIEENVSGALIADRDDLNIELPSWVKITGIKWDTVSPAGLVTARPTAGDGTKSDLDVPIAASTGPGVTGKLKFTLELSIEANKTGDIEATITGAGVDEVKVVIAKAVAPVTASAEVKDVLIGTQNQEVADLFITETTKEAMMKKPNSGADGNLVLTLTEGARFTAAPKVEVIEGNLEIKTEEVRLATGDTQVLIPIKSESTKPSKLQVSNIKLTVDRTVPEGAVKVKVQGATIAENNRGASGWLDGQKSNGAGNTLDAGEFETGTVVSVQIARVITPAPTDKKSLISFVIGESKYTANGIEQTMDVASYIKNDRTYLPVRYVASALGVTDSNIIWNDFDKTATLIKGDKVVQLKVGDTKMVVNGVAIAMDVAPEIASDRLMLPFRFIAQAFGASVAFDDATRTVSMEL